MPRSNTVTQWEQARRWLTAFCFIPFINHSGFKWGKINSAVFQWKTRIKLHYLRFLKIPLRVFLKLICSGNEYNDWLRAQDKRQEQIKGLVAPQPQLFCLVSGAVKAGEVSQHQHTHCLGRVHSLEEAVSFVFVYTHLQYWLFAVFDWSDAFPKT